MTEIHKTKVTRTKNTRICQGDIFKNVDFIESIFEKSGTLEISRITFPYVVVLTQDCELQQDYNHRKSMALREKQNKMLLSVLVAPLYNAEHVFMGTHLSELGISCAPINKDRTEGKTLMDNERPRYHYIEFPETVSISPSIIDFKHYFSVNVEYLRKLKTKSFVCKISELYREDVSVRFANYLSRIGLP
jgi:hypothetical protein